MRAVHNIIGLKQSLNLPAPIVYVELPAQHSGIDVHGYYSNPDNIRTIGASQNIFQWPAVYVGNNSGTFSLNYHQGPSNHMLPAPVLSLPVAAQLPIPPLISSEFCHGPRQNAVLPFTHNNQYHTGQDRTTTSPYTSNSETWALYKNNDSDLLYSQISGPNTTLIPANYPHPIHYNNGPSLHQQWTCAASNSPEEPNSQFLTTDGSIRCSQINYNQCNTGSSTSPGSGVPAADKYISYSPDPYEFNPEPELSASAGRTTTDMRGYSTTTGNNQYLSG
ncbi:hypothetical protein DFH27DRAFT_637098 [Peziza echinospora]|nr:hypothetical protein DFH27DRAFT_637098 [Peziza echinospora]